MIKFGLGTSEANSSFEEAEVGDKFVLISYWRYDSGVQSVISYTVMKVGKRDIVCQSKNSGAITINRKRGESCCYPPDSPKVNEAIRTIELQNRRAKCRRILEGGKQAFDEQFMTAIEEFGARLEKAKSCAG